jgi:hypothetical protein
VLDDAIDAPVTTPTRAGTVGSTRWASGSLHAIGLFLASRVVVAIGLVVATNVVHRSIEHILTSWDAMWYLSIARSGYVTSIPRATGIAAQSNLGFFPLLPILIRGVHDVSGLGYADSGIALSFVAGMLASVAIWRLLSERFGSVAADRGTAIVLFSPGAFVLSFVYTEGVAILLVACTLLALHRRRWVLAGVCAGIVTAADPVASAVIVPCVIASVAAIRSRGEWRSLVAPLLAPVGIVAFFSYLWAHTGTPFEWFHAQRAGWQGGVYFWGVPKAAISLVLHGVANMNPGVKTACTVLAVVLVVRFLRQHPPSMWTGYVLAVLALGVISPVIGITPRLLLRDFPLLGAVGATLSARRLRVVLACSGVAMAGLVVAASTPRFTP